MFLKVSIRFKSCYTIFMLLFFFTFMFFIFVSIVIIENSSAA